MCPGLTAALYRRRNTRALPQIPKEVLTMKEVVRTVTKEVPTVREVVLTKEIAVSEPVTPAKAIEARRWKRCVYVERVACHSWQRSLPPDLLQRPPDDN